MAKIYVPYIKTTCPKFFTVWTQMFIIHINIHEFTSLKRILGLGVRWILHLAAFFNIWTFLKHF